MSRLRMKRKAISNKKEDKTENSNNKNTSIRQNIITIPLQNNEIKNEEYSPKNIINLDNFIIYENSNSIEDEEDLIKKEFDIPKIVDSNHNNVIQCCNKIKIEEKFPNSNHKQNGNFNNNNQILNGKIISKFNYVTSEVEGFYKEKYKNKPFNKQCIKCKNKEFEPHNILKFKNIDELMYYLYLCYTKSEKEGMLRIEKEIFDTNKKEMLELIKQHFEKNAIKDLLPIKKIKIICKKCLTYLLNNDNMIYNLKVLLQNREQIVNPTEKLKKHIGINNSDVTRKFSFSSNGLFGKQDRTENYKEVKYTTNTSKVQESNSLFKEKYNIFPSFIGQEVKNFNNSTNNHANININNLIINQILASQTLKQVSPILIGSKINKNLLKHNELSISEILLNSVIFELKEIKSQIENFGSESKPEEKKNLCLQINKRIEEILKNKINILKNISINQEKLFKSTSKGFKTLGMLNQYISDIDLQVENILKNFSIISESGVNNSILNANSYSMLILNLVENLKNIKFASAFCKNTINEWIPLNIEKIDNSQDNMSQKFLSNIGFELESSQSNLLTLLASHMVPQSYNILQTKLPQFSKILDLLNMANELRLEDEQTKLN